MNTKHGFLNLCGRAVYATLYMPDAQPEKAVVMCEPFADEKRCAFRMIVRLAEKIASAGIAVMRFDVSGTGDSASSHADAEWDNWCAETVAAVNFIKQHYRVRFAPYTFGKLTAFLVADISRRCSDKPRHRELLHIFAHINANQSIVSIK